MEPTPIQPTASPEPIPEVWIQAVCRKNGTPLKESQVHKLSTYTQLLLEWNSKVNLISRKDIDNIWKAHILHSLSILLMVDIPIGKRVLDLGSGGGLPGIVLKIVRPDLDIVCLDATKKKMDAVDDMIRRLELNGIKAVWGRAEELGHQQEFSHQFEVAVARAVAPLRDIISWSRPFLKRPTAASQNQTDSRSITLPAIIALKGGDLSSEIHQARSKFQDTVITERSLIFHGAEMIPGTEKKILTIEL